MKNEEAYAQKLHAKVDEWNADIDKLIAKADQLEADSRIEYQEQIEALKGKRNEIEKKLSELSRASEGAMEDIKSGIDLACEAMNDAIKLASARFK